LSIKLIKNTKPQNNPIKENTRLWNAADYRYNIPISRISKASDVLSSLFNSSMKLDYTNNTMTKNLETRE
jgi:hypothetical protein